MMHYRVQYLAVTTTVLSLILPTGLALSDMGVADAKRRSISQRLSQKSITAQVQTKKQLGEEALRLYKSGSELYRKGLRIEGFEKFQQALKIFRQIGDRAQEGYILKKIGEAYFYTEDFATALNSYQKALAIFKEIDDELGIAKSLRGMGNIYSSVGEYSKSSDSYQQALNIFKKIGNRVEEGWTLKDIGYSLYGSQENYSKALDYLWEALIVLRKTNDKLGESVTLKDIALIYSRQGNFLKALEYGKQASVIARQIKDKQLLAWILSDIGEHYFKLKKDYPKALEYFNKALNVFEKIDHWGGRGWVLKHIAESNFKLKRYDKALQYFQQALTVFERIGSLNGQGWTLDDMAEIYFVIGRYSDAEKALWDTITIWEYSKEKLNDTQKITIANNKRSTFRLMQRVLIAQNKVETALEISERSRSRALIDLLASKQSADSNNQVYSKSPSLEDMKRIAKQRNATIVEYSVIDSGEHLVIDDSLLYIWVVKPTGEIAFEKVDIKTFNKPLKNFVASSRNSIGARGRGIFKIAQNPLTRKLYSRSQT
ncbi:MAG: tetratricopeptide repeat protein, partial [Cyanobacteria bacterium P01_A01_bin.84]